MVQQIDVVANLLMKVDGAEAGIKKIQNSLSKLKLPEGLDNNFKKSFSNLETILARYRSQVEKGFETKGDVSAFNKTSKQLDAELNKLSRHFTELTGKPVDFKVKSDALVNAEKELQNLIDKKSQLTKEALNLSIKSDKGGAKEVETLLQKLQEVAGNTKTGIYAKDALSFLKAGDLKGTVNELEKASVAYKRLGDAKKDAFKDTGFDIGTALQKIISELTNAEGKFTQFDGAIETTKTKISEIRADQMDKVAQYADNAAQSFEKERGALEQVNGAMQEYARSSQSMTQQLGDLQQSTQYFFSLRNMINLLKRGIDDAVQSVKDLDRAMTETAVVTDYKVSDLWGMLPEYTKIANQLGATTQGAYETMTLYFQQGLDQQAAFEIGEETMKMARIAGLDYAKTTDMMTAALRGFNMELNEVSAQRVNDVYSNLAAKTASDTKELGTAMQRTASIAHSAGMSFEGTAAFLAQAIETTREPAENIGTAMKTIVARFQEMKKNPLEISEVEGEEVNYNKIDEALKTIGVDLKDTNGQFRDLDQVFLDISQKWDSLSQVQQRYIATTAAGSRQQSRFIAMMSDYNRTVELMSYANDSAGASQEQFDKTMDSLESKLNQLHNAWQAFTMGIANNSMIKVAVDGLTKILSTTNKLIDTFSLGIGPLKSFLSIFSAFTGLKAIGKFANAAIGGLGSLVDPQTSFRQGFFGGGINIKQNANAAQASMIYSPIVNEIRAFRAQIAKEEIKNDAINNNPYNQYEQFKKARKNISQLTGRNKEFSANDYIQEFNGLSKEQQNILRNGSAYSAYKVDDVLLRQFGGSDNQLKDLRKAQAAIRSNAKAGNIAWQEYYNKVSDPIAMRKALEQAPNVSKATLAWLDGMAEKTTEQAKHNFANNIEQELFDSGFFDDILNNEDYKNKLSEEANRRWEALSEAEQEAYRGEAFRQERGGQEPKIKNSLIGKALEGFGKMGAAVSSAGIGIQTFGSLLSSSANPALQTFGAALTSIGSTLIGLGGLISEVSTGFTAVSESSIMTSIATNILGATEETVAAKAALATGVIGAAIAAIGLLVFAIKKHNENIRKAAEEVSTNYKDRNEKAQTNINNLQSWKEDFAKLSGGVDANGNNINLSTEEYDRYLEIAKGIAEINPSIVDGYNAQGQAIINNNKALEETLALEKQHQQDAYQDYISPDSTRKLQKALNLEKTNKYIDSKGNYTSGNLFIDSGYTSTKGGVAEKEYKPQATMRKEAQQIGKNLQKGIKEGWASGDLLKDFNIDIAKLAEGDESTLRQFDKLGPKIQQRINRSMDEGGDKVKESTKNKILDAFTGYSDAADELDELIQPLYEQSLVKMGPVIQSIPQEFRGYFNQGLKEIVSDANITDIDGEAQRLAKGFSSLTAKGGEYYKLMQDVEQAQNEYATTLDKTKYDDFINGTDGARQRIEELKNSLARNGMDLTQGYGKAVSDFLDSELAKIENFTKDGAANLQKALNTMTDQIAAAEGALESFNTIAEGSTYGKAAKNMAQVFETATADEHTLGVGDQAFWAGAETLVGRKNLLENGETTKEDALEMMKAVQQMVQGGAEGWDAFKMKWFDTADANFKTLEDGSRRLLDENGKIIEGLKLDDNNWISEIDEKVNPEVYDQIADALDMSKESLIAMLNLGRQFGEVDFTNIQDVRKALATSENTIKNAENGKVFAKKESFEAEMTQAGIDLNKQQDIERELQEKYNTEFIQSVDQIAKDNSQLTRMGIKDMDSLIKTFDATGQYTKDEIAKYAEAYQKSQGKEFNQAEFEEKWNANQQDTEFGGIPSSLTSIESILSSIESILASQRLEEGYLDNATAKDSQQWLFGREGEDTAAQKFWKGHGSGANGEITTSEFNQTSSDLKDFISTSKDYIKQLNDTKPANETERKQIEAEKAAYENMLERAQTYLKEGTEAYSQQISGKLSELQTNKDLINKGISDLFANVTPESINNEQAQATLEQLYSAVMNNTQLTLTDGLMAQMQALGIDIQSAIDAGLVIDPNHLITKGTETGKKGAEATEQGLESGLDGVDTTKGKNAAEAKAREGLNSYMNGLSNATPTVSPTPKTQPTPTKSSTPTESKQEASVTYKVKIANEGEIKNSVESQLNKILKSAAAKTQQVEANGSIKVNYEQGKQPKAQNQTAKVNYIKGTQAKPEAMSAKINYIKGSQAPPTSPKSATVNYKLGSQEKPENKTAWVTYKKRGPSTGGFITPGGVLYRAKGGRAEWPGYPKKGTDRIPAYLTPGEYVQNRSAVQYFGIDFMRKINHKDLAGALQSFGSAAKGLYGRLGPDGNGGLTLTGEQGYEVAWIPSENRSMILGANGPQMINLPPDAVIWNHKQSKKIMSQDAIPAGSHYVTSRGASRPTRTLSVGSSSVSSSGGSRGSSQSSSSGDDENKKSQKINHFSIYEIIRFDNDQYLAVLSSEISKRTKSIEKSLKKIGTQANSIRSTIQDQVTALEQVKKNNQDNLNAYKNEINDFLSQQALATWTDANGDSQERKFDIRSFIGQANGTYAIDWKAIQNTASSREEREAIYKELQPIKNLTDGVIKAQEAIDDANEQIEKLGEQLAEQFYNWKSELTEIYDLSQRITDQESLRSRFTSQINLELSKLSAGFGTATEAIQHMTAARERDNKTVLRQIENQQLMIGARQRELNRALDVSDELATLNAYKSRGYSTASEKNAAVAWAQGEYDAARIALQYVKDIRKDRDGSVQYTIDWATFDRQQASNPYSKDTYDKIKEYLDNLNSAAEEFNNSIKTQTETIAQLYDDLKEYQDFIGSFEDTLIKTIESDIEQQLENAKRLSDSITVALKDLLDQVKRKLDERRQAEDNAKTEADIARKQQRLAMLQANSAGGNQVEIAQLQKEIADAQQSYQRTLEDQLLNKLQQQGDDAAKQREHQIELQKAQLDVEKETNKELVNLWLSNPEQYKNEIRDAWLEAQGYEDKGIAGQAVLESEFESEFAKLGLAIEETNYKNGFEDISGDTSTLVGLLTKLTNGEDAGTDPLSKAVGALEDVTKRNTESFELSKKTQQSASAWKNEGITAKDLKAWDYTFKELKDSGFTNADLKNAGFTLQDFQQGGVTKAADLKDAGFSVAELKNAKYSFNQLKEANFSLAQLRQGGFGVPDFMAGGVKDAKSLRGAGFTAADLKKAKFTSKALKDAGYSASDLLKGGYSAKDLRTGGYTAAQAKAAGVSAAGLKGAGYAYTDAKKSGYTLQQLYSGGYGEAYWEIWPYGRVSDNRRNLYYGDRGNDVKALQWALNKIMGTHLSINGVYDDATWDAVAAFEYQAYTSKYGSPTTGDNIIGPEAREEFRKRGFKTGGIADFTGPAWLDGTPSKPELVLNAQDTKNFLTLKDVLRGAMSSIGSVKGLSYGDMTYEININVDHINNDYDVDRIAERVKKNIVKDASYRNVTQVRNFR